MGIETTGIVHSVFDAKQVSERFTKREFVLELADNPKYPQVVMFQATGDRCSQLDAIKVGDQVKVEFSLRGREWRSPSGEVKYFNTLDVWKVERVGAAKSATSGAPSVPVDPPGAPVPEGDIPFATRDMASEPSPIARVIR